MKFLRSSIKNLSISEIGIKIRNSLKIKTIPVSIRNLNYVSISDSFAWRTDNNFVTKFKYSDILNLFFKSEDSWVEFHFFSKNNKLIKIVKKKELNLSNEIVINSEYLGGIKDYGTFYIYHFSKKKFKEESIISNRCYLGYSKNNNLYSFVHGNTLAKFTKISSNKEIKSDIVKTSFFLNHYYKIQKFLDGFDKHELFFSNPSSKKIKFKIDNNFYELKDGCSLLIDVSLKKIITIKSNCMFLRPTMFSYKNDFLDVHHC